MSPSLFLSFSFSFHTRTGTMEFPATAPDYPSWAPSRRDLTPAPLRCLTPLPRISSRPTSHPLTSLFLTTKARTLTPMSMTPTPWTPCISPSSTLGGRGRGKRWAPRRAPCYPSLGLLCPSCRDWTPGGTTTRSGGQTSCYTRLTMAWTRGWAMRSLFTALDTQGWRTSR